MANSDKNIVITPNTGLSTDPTITLTGAGNSSISIGVSTDSFGTLEFKTRNDRIFSINNNLSSGSLFRVTGSFGNNLFEAYASGDVTLGSYQTDVKGKGLKLPEFSSNTLPSAEKGQMVYDKLEKVAKIYNGFAWDNLNDIPIVRNGLVVYLDPNNPSSVKPNYNRINSYHWTEGAGGVSAGTLPGSVAYNQNGATNENQRVVATNPFGYQSIVWETRASGNGNDDGGWNTDGINIDNRKLYRFSVWMRRTSSTSGGTFYLGLGDYGNNYQSYVSDGTYAGNPYWECVGTSKYTQNQWYLVVGHVFPQNTTNTARHPDTGFYVPGSNVRVLDINGCNVGNDVKWGPSGASATYHRTYHYYCGDSTTRLQFWDPRIDECDGSQPSISDLVNGRVHTWYDLSGNQNHCYWNNLPPYYSNTFTPGKPKSSGAFFTFNGSTNYGTIPNVDFRTEQSCMMWLRHTYTSGRRNPWNQAYAGAGTWTMEQGDNMSWYYGNAGNDTTPYVGRSNSVVRRGEWNFLATTRNTSNDYGYTNGVLTSSNSNPYGTLAATGANITLGNGYAGYWQGDMGPVLVYNRYLTQSEIQQNYNAFRERYGGS